jgi:hypothetical protein
MTNPICCVDDCETISRRFGYCKKHWLRWSRYGDPHAEIKRPARKICVIDGCERFMAYIDLGWCSAHQLRWKRTGDPLGSKPRRARSMCKVEHCGKFVKGHGLCHTHLARQRRNGSPVLQPPFDERIAYEAKVDRSGGPDACHPWIGKRDRHGYARGTRDGKQNVMMQAWAYRTFVGPLGPNELVRHTCDNPPCQNQRHWLPGTHQDNANDKVERNRSIRGEQHSSAKLTRSQVQVIRSRTDAGEGYQSVASDYGVHATSIKLIHRRVNWAWLPEVTQADVDLAGGP